MNHIVDKIEIKASKSEIWDLLTNPKKTPTYMFTCAIESNLNEGDTIFWRGIHDQVVYVSGTLIKYVPKNLMIYSVIDPNADYPQTDKNHLTVTYELETSSDSTTLLKVTQSGYDTVAQGKERYEEAMSSGGWSVILQKIKEIAES